MFVTCNLRVPAIPHTITFPVDFAVVGPRYTLILCYIPKEHPRSVCLEETQHPIPGSTPGPVPLSRFLIKKIILGGLPSGAAVKCARSTLVARAAPVRILGVDMAPLGMPCCSRRPTYKVEADGHGC